MLIICPAYCVCLSLSQVDELQERSSRLENMCMARYEAGEQSRAYNEFKDRYNSVSLVVLVLSYGWLSAASSSSSLVVP